MASKILMASKFDATSYFSAMCDGECLEGELHTWNWILMGTFPYMYVFLWFAWRISLQKQIDYLYWNVQLSFTRLESKPVLAIALLPYLLPDTRLKADGSHKNNQVCWCKFSSKPVLAIALLPYLLPDTRLKADGSHKNNQVCWCKFSSVCCTRKKLTIASIQLQKKSTNGNFMGGFFLCLCAGVRWSWERSKGPGFTAMPSGSRYPYQLQGCIFIMWRNNHLQSCISRYCITVASNFFCFQHTFYSGLFKLLLLFGVSLFRFKTSQEN